MKVGEERNWTPNGKFNRTYGTTVGILNFKDKDRNRVDFLTVPRVHMVRNEITVVLKPVRMCYFGPFIVREHQLSK